MEVNPATNEIQWEYRAENPVDFYSTWAGSCQRLPNGNTLICEAALGRLFEVTHKGEMVWEYVVPFYGHVEGYMLELSNAVHRCYRYSPDYPGLQGKNLDPRKLETWNRLYSPGTFISNEKSLNIGAESIPFAEETVVIEEKVPHAEYKESRPSVTQTSKEKDVDSRLRYLGY